MSNMSDRERAIRQKLKDDFEHYANKCLRLRAKSGKVLPFNLNRSQRFLHERSEPLSVCRAPVEAACDVCRYSNLSALQDQRTHFTSALALFFQAFV